MGAVKARRRSGCEQEHKKWQVGKTILDTICLCSSHGILYLKDILEYDSLVPVFSDGVDEFAQS